MSSRIDDEDRHDKLDALFAACLAKLDHGETIDIERLAAEHPEFSTEIREFFETARGIELMAGPISDDTIDTGGSASIAPPAIGAIRHFGDYELLSEIARGGMGVVYRARQTSLRRIVAVKMILAGQLASRMDVERFRAEAEAAANLWHHGIVSIFEVGERDGHHYFSMEFVDGKDLGALARDNMPSSMQAAEYAKQVAETIQFAHDHGTLHRDLKPSNILVDAEGFTKITDFGLAKRIGMGSNLTATGAVLGTPSYMPPEQATTGLGPVGPASDVYAIGAVLYELLTGRPPFRAATPLDTVMQVVHEEPVEPRLLNPKIPRDLETITLKCLEKSAARRYSTARALADDLGRLIAGEPILARPSTRRERMVKWARRRPAVAALLVALFLALFLGFDGMTFLFLRAERQRAEADNHRVVAVEATKKADEQRDRAVRAASEESAARRALERAQDQANNRLYSMSIALAQREWSAGNLSRALSLLDECPGDRRNWEWNYLKQLCDGSSLTIWPHVGGVDQLAVCADGTRIVSVGNDRWLTVSDAKMGRILGTVRVPASAGAIDPQGRWVALIAGKRVELRDGATGNVSRALPIESINNPAVSFGANGSTLVVMGVDEKDPAAARFITWDAASGNKQLEGTFPARVDVRCMAARSDGQRLAYQGNDNSLHFVDLAAGREIKSFRGTLLPGSKLCFNPAGDRLACAGGDGTVTIWNVEDSSSDPVHLLRGHRRSVTCLQYNRDGSRLLTGGVDATVRVWDTADGSELLSLPVTDTSVMSLALEPDGRSVVVGAAQGSIRRWALGSAALPESEWFAEAAVAMGLSPERAATERSTFRNLLSDFYSATSRVLWGFTTMVQGVAYGPNGRLASVGLNGSVVVWDGKNGNQVFRARRDGWRGLSIAASGDGRLIAAGMARPRRSPTAAGPGAEVALWDLSTKTLIKTLPLPEGNSLALAFTPDSKNLVALASDHNPQTPFIAASGNVRPATIKVWEVPTGVERHTFQVHAASATAMALFPDGERVATVGADQPPASFAAGSPVIAAPSTVRIWRLAEQRQERAINVNAGYMVSGLAVSPDGGELAAACADGTARRWDANSGAERATLRGASGPTLSLAYSPDGRRLVVADQRGDLKIWNVVDGGEVLTLRGHNDSVYAVAFSRDGVQIASAGFDSTVRLWDAPRRDYPSVEQWTTLFHDDFEKGELGNEWKPLTGKWTIDHGTLRGELVEQKTPGVNVDFAAACLSLDGLALPEEIEVTFETWHPEPLGYQTIFAPFVAVELLGVANSFTKEKGANVWAVPHPGEYTPARMTSAFVSSSGERHQVRILRQGKWLRAIVDGREVISMPFNAETTDSLLFQPIYGKNGAAWFMDNLAIRAPSPGPSR